METKIKNIEDLGYDNFLKQKRKELGLDEFLVARVASEHKGAYKVINERGEFLAKVTGKQMFVASSREDYPAVGDWVAITELPEKQAVINVILPRKSMIKRKKGDKTESQIIGTNIDVAFAVESMDRDYSLNRFERYFSIAKDGGVKPAIILNKTDLISEEELSKRTSELKDRFEGADIICTSAANNVGIEQLKTYILKGKTYCFLGSSGVGKSSIINSLIGQALLKTGDVSLYSDRGKHVTTRREMYILENGGIVIDNPGMREVGMTDSKSGVEAFFGDITSLGSNCKFKDCTHTHEPGCSVLQALESGELDGEQYRNYVNLRKEADFYEMSELEKRQKDRSFGKFIKTAKKEIKSNIKKNI